MKKIIIHAGPGKTGTSAIQYWCVTHREELQHCGVFYPAHSLDKNNVSNGHIDFIADINDNGRYVINEDKLSLLLSKFHDSESKILVLSSEYFIEHIPKLLELVDNSNILLYFRDPIELHQSSYIQKVKRHQFTDEYKIRSNIHYPILNLLDTLIKTIDSSRISVRPYDVSLSGSEDLVADFLNFIEFDLISRLDFKKSIRVNDSYSFAALEFKRLCNFFPIEKIEVRLDSILQKISGEERRYSLISNDSYEYHLSRMISKVESIKKRSGSNKILNDLSLWLSDIETNKVVNPCSSLSLLDISNLANDIKIFDPSFYQQLSQLIVDHNYIYTGVDGFIDIFECNKVKKRDYFSLKKTSKAYNEPTIMLPSVSIIDTFRHRLGIKGNVRQAMIYAAMSDFMNQSGEYEMAEKLVNKAIQLNPTNELALDLVNKIRFKVQCIKNGK